MNSQTMIAAPPDADEFIVARPDNCLAHALDRVCEVTIQALGLLTEGQAALIARQQPRT